MAVTSETEAMVGTLATGRDSRTKSDTIYCRKRFEPVRRRASDQGSRTPVAGSVDKMGVQISIGYASKKKLECQAQQISTPP